MIEIKNLTKKFNKGMLTALDGVNCKIESNRIVGLIGPDGSGKTTLLRIVAGIMTPNSGEIIIDGKNLEIGGETDIKKKDTVSIKELHNMIAYMPQKFGLYEDLSVLENLELYAKLQNLSDEEKDKSFESVLAITRLNSFQKRLAGNLSGGMKQKLGLACSLLKKPKILILDEPSVGVDPISRQDLILMVNSMLDEQTTVLWSTAYLDEAENLDYVILLNSGSVIFEGSPKDAIKNIHGRVYFFPKILKNKREFSYSLLKVDGVVDSVIQGQNVRFLSKTNDVKSIYDEMRLKFNDLEKPRIISPSFEDACVDMLGGIGEKESPVSEYIKDVQFTGGDNVVEAISLTKKFGDFTAVSNVSFNVKRGQILGLLGPNGSGKSTTFRMLCGLLLQNSGTAKIVGIDIADLGSDAKTNLGYMAQKFSLYQVLSVRQNLEFFSGAYRLTGKEKKLAVESMLDIFHLRKLENVSAAVLSLGYKQRLALACSIMHKPQVLFLDEPTSGVDAITRKEFWMHINAMVTHGISVVVTTHFMDEAENCDEIALVYKGKIRATGTPDDLKVLCKEVEDPTLEQAFISIIKETDEAEGMIQGQFKE